MPDDTASTDTDNAIVPELAFDPERGALTYRGVRYLIVRPETMHGFYRAVVAQVPDRAANVLYAGGFAGGRASAIKFAGESAEATVDFMCRMGRDIGWGRLERVALDETARRLVIEATGSPFAEAARAAGDTAEPVCHLLRGVAGGLATAVFGLAEDGSQVRAVETACAATGAERCRLEARALAPDEVSLTPEPTLQSRFHVLAEITRAQHFAWRQSVVEMCPDVDAAEVGNRMWKITAAETAKAYLKRLDLDRPLAPQLAASFAWSSVCMNEAASVKAGQSDAECFVVHDDCPWFHWHKRLGLLAEDRPGCDTWFQTVIAEVARATGRDIRIETIGTLPDGDQGCTRRITEAPAR